MRRHQRSQRTVGFTIVELLVVVSIIALLVGILLPAIGKARDSARMTISESNLRNLGTAHATYSSEWNDRQFTLCKDDLAAFGGSDHLGLLNGWLDANGGTHPGVILGWDNISGGAAQWYFPINTGSYGNANYGLITPMTLDDPSDLFGSFRLPNVRQFSQYLNGRFFDSVFYAPKDTHVMNVVEPYFELSAEWTDPGEHPEFGGGSGFWWSSYCMSPAGMYNPGVFRRPSKGGPQCPWDLKASYRSPGYSQARYPNLKTHMLEHHWLQNNHRDECNPNFAGGTYNGCEPFYFNGGVESAPVTLFYDGHIRVISNDEARNSQLRLIAQLESGDHPADVLFYGDGNGANPAGPVCAAEDGYFEDEGFMFSTQVHADVSYHILTVDGILGRDTLGN